MPLKKKKIAIAGVGTVGKGLIQVLEQFGARVPNLKVSAIASRRNFKLPKKKIFENIIILKDAKELLGFNDYDILVELIGGESGIAKDIVINALNKGKHVVTANKALISKYWKLINNLSENNKCLIKYEAAVAGGIPIIKIFDDFLISNEISQIYGILNGTSNFILTKMLNTGKNFDEILKEAQKLGYAEADPTFDIDGIDTAHKLSILCSLAFKVDCKLSEIKTEGIRSIDLIDLKLSQSLGYKIKLLGISEKKNKEIKNYVYPCLVKNANFIANVDGVYNGVVVESNFCNKSFFQGEGAGALPTATSVFSDINSILSSDKINLKLKKKNYAKFSSLEKRFGEYYLRFTTEDKPGVISDITKEFKKNKISMKSMLQEDSKSTRQKNATIVITTHNCEEKNMIDALNRINNMNFIKKKTVYFRIENFIN